MEVKYIKIFLDNLEMLEALTDTQRGKLILLMMQYAKNRKVPQCRGVMRYVFPIFRAQIDREIAGMEARGEAQSRGGKKSAGRRKLLEDTLSQMQSIDIENRV